MSGIISSLLTIIHTDVDDKIAERFYNVVNKKRSSKDTGFKNALEEAMLDYVQRNSDSPEETKKLARTAKTVRSLNSAPGNSGTSFTEEVELHSKLQMLGVNVGKLKNMNATVEQIRDLVAGLEKLLQKGYFN